MKERPILFSAPMVRAILDGRKTQTRRVVKPQPVELPDFNRGGLSYNVRGSVYRAWNPSVMDPRCPYGQPGDRLWVRETWQAATGSKRDARILTCPRPDTGWVEYAATCDDPPPRWRPSIYMPRWASRILLEITGVRVERLTTISVSDAIAEGYDGSVEDPIDPSVKWYSRLWESINGAGSWAVDPWVWVIEFRRLEK